MAKRPREWLRGIFEIPPSRPSSDGGRSARRFRDYHLPRVIPLLVLHGGAIVGIVLGASLQVWLVALALFLVRMFGVTAGYHRYFSHRSFKTSRAMQAGLALLAESSSQRGALWWAAHHREHHKHSDTDRDLHSPQQHGVWHSHLGWLYDGNDDTDYERVKDLARYPELVVLNRLWLLPPIALALVTTLVWGLPGLLVGFMLSTVLTWHATFTVNSLAHMWGTQRYETGDTSRNNWLLALLTLGEGWHNNHHHSMGSVRQGFYWWEIDVTYYVLKAMSWVGLVWDLKRPPEHVYDASSPSRVTQPP